MIFPRTGTSHFAKRGAPKLTPITRIATEDCPDCGHPSETVVYIKYMTYDQEVTGVWCAGCYKIKQ